MRNIKQICSVTLPFLLLLMAAGWQAAFSQPKTKVIRVFFEIKETNFDKASTAAINTLSERLNSSGFRVTTNRKEAAIVLEGTIGSRLTPVADEVKKEGGVNAEAAASLRLLVGGDVIASTVQRSTPGDWGVLAERVGEDRLIEVAGLVADDLIMDSFVQEIIKLGSSGSTESKPPERPVNSRLAKSVRKPAPRRGVGFFEIASLLQKYTPENRVVEVVKKYGIKFKPLESALSQLRGLGASEGVINAIKTSNVNS